MIHKDTNSTRKPAQTCIICNWGDFCLYNFSVYLVCLVVDGLKCTFAHTLECPFMKLLENIRQALYSIRANMLRAVLTFMIIAFGLMALVGILTAIDSINAELSSNFSSMGANTFNIVRGGSGISNNRRRRGDPISYRDALEFKELYEFPATVSISALGTSLGTVKYKDEKTNPNITVYGGDENYLEVAGYEVEYGRNFSIDEVESGRSHVILGVEIVDKLFDQTSEALGQVVNVNNFKYRVIGILEEKGSSSSFSGDKMAFIPDRKSVV